MARLVLGERSFLSWHMQRRAELEGITLTSADPVEYLATMPTAEDVELVFDDPAEDTLEADSDNAVDSAAAGDGADSAELSPEEEQRQRIIEAMRKARETEKTDLTHIIYLADTRLWTTDEGTVPSDEELAEQIRRNTEAVVQIFEQLPSTPEHFILATSINAGNSTPVGQALAETSVLLDQATADYATRYVELQFPHLFGEGCPAHRSALIAQLARAIAAGKSPRVNQDRPMTVMYAQDAADVLTQPMPDFALPTATTFKESTSEYAILMNEAAGIVQDGRLPQQVAPDQYGLLFSLYSTLLAAQIEAEAAAQVDADDCAAQLNTLEGDVVTFRLPRVSSRIRTVTPDAPVEFTSNLEGLHRLVILSGDPTITVGDATYIKPSSAEQLPFLDLPHGYSITLRAGQSPCLIGEWVSEV